jgi:hypothetical protein
MLVVHLYNHEKDHESQEENARTALKTHLRWNSKQVEKVMAYSLDAELIFKEPGSDSLNLTKKGRVIAQEVLEPWRQV